MKAVVFIANGSEEVETLTPLDYLRRAKVDVDFVSVGADDENVVTSHKVKICADMTLDEYMKKGEVPDCVVVPGGIPGAPNIAGTKNALDLIEKVFDSGKLVCAVCASPAVVLGKTKVLSGKKWTCYPGMRDEAPDYAGGHVDGVSFVHDENVITGCGAGAAEEWSMEIVKTLCGEAEYQRIKAGTCQR